MTQNLNKFRNPRQYSKEEMKEFLQHLSTSIDDRKLHIAANGSPESWCMSVLDGYKEKIVNLHNEISAMESESEDYPQYILDEHSSYQDWFYRAVYAWEDYHANLGPRDTWACYLA